MRWIVIETKVCNTCDIEKDISEFYCDSKYSKTKGEYIYYNPRCKKCVSTKAQKWGLDNKERRNVNTYNYDKSPKGKENIHRKNTKYTTNGKRKDWRGRNKDKLYGYGKNHRNHILNNNEWKSCKNYFNYRCAYCGLSEEEHKQMYNQQLHKEHVYPKGNNDLSNCVPACKSCNSLKSNIEFEVWYKEGNERFSEERLHRITQWLESDYKIYKE